MIRAKIILDSISEVGNRLTTFELTYPRFIHAEFMTHRALSKNAASSRAIPIEKMIDKVNTDPAQIVWWGKNQSGMQAKEELEGEQLRSCKLLWETCQHNAIQLVQTLSLYGLHKQITNRLLEPFMNITVICTGTEWNNFYGLRCHPDAQPEIQRLAYCMLREQYISTPTLLKESEWHTPYLTDLEKDLDLDLKLKISTAKCARVSYLTQSGTRDYNKDLELYDRLETSGHFSPFEHVATPINEVGFASGNFVGWKQYRKTLKQDVRTTIPTQIEVEEYFRQC